MTPPRSPHHHDPPLPVRTALVTTTPYHLPRDPTDGFAPRYTALIDTLAGLGDLQILYTPPGSTAPETVADDGRVRVVTMPGPLPRTSRRARVAGLARSVAGRPEPWEPPLLARLAAWDPDVVFAVSHGGGPEWWGLCARFPVVLAVEERPPERGRTLPGKLLRAVEAGVARHRHPTPAGVVVISEREAPWAARQYPGAEVFTLPHTIDLDHWSPRRGPGTRDLPVLSVAYFAHDRNAAGLVAVADALARLAGPAAPRITAVGVPPPRGWGLGSGAPLIDAVGEVDDPRDWYDRAQIALVPAFEVSGAKTTILQAWAMGVPVVTTLAAAASVGATPGAELLAGSTPAEVARQLLDLTGRHDRRAALVDRAGARLLAHHGRGAFEQRLRAILEAVGTGGAGAARRAHR